MLLKPYIDNKFAALEGRLLAAVLESERRQQERMEELLRLLGGRQEGMGKEQEGRKKEQEGRKEQEQ